MQADRSLPTVNTKLTAVPSIQWPYFIQISDRELTLTCAWVYTQCGHALGTVTHT